MLHILFFIILFFDLKPVGHFRRHNEIRSCSYAERNRGYKVRVGGWRNEFMRPEACWPIKCKVMTKATARLLLPPTDTGRHLYRDQVMNVE